MTDHMMWLNGILNEAFDEHRHCIEEVHGIAKEILVYPPCAQDKFKVHIGAIPPDFFSIKKNIFSTLFQSVYHILEIDKKKCLLYGKINYLFRIWVTSADNLLDKEDKVVIPIEMPGKSRIMREVISVMLADRVMKRIFENAVEKKVISKEESRVLSEKSLQILLPSAAEEALEEQGVTGRARPEHVLYTIHRLRTGLLFHVPFLGPDNIEKNVNADKLNICKEALYKFGIGCQLLDDIRDMARDYIEKRHNYVLSKIYWDGERDDILRLENPEYGKSVSAKIFPHFLKYAHPAAELAREFLHKGLSLLGGVGLGIDENTIEGMVCSMFNVLDVGELEKCTL